MEYLLILTLLFPSTLSQQSEISEQFLTGYTAFAADVYKGLMKSDSDNFIFCPLSAYTVLALVESGAEGQTAKELATTLRLPSSREETHQIFRTVSTNLQNTKECILSTANKIYVKDGYQLRDEFKTVAVDIFDSEVENIEFSDSRKAADKIDRWVENKTHKKISYLMDSDKLDDLTRAVLVNTMYFDSKWVYPFNTYFTELYDFYITSDDRVKTYMMIQESYYGYYQCPELDAEFLKLDFKGGDVSMHIVLPDEVEGLAALEEKISDALNPPVYKYSHVHVIIPKLNIEHEIKFKPILEKMGIKEAFSDDANFQGLSTGTEHLRISEVIQKVLIEVDEEGTIGAAGTIGVVKEPTIATNPKIFFADHPFLFYLRLNKLGVNFFIGRFTAPTEEID